MCRMLLRVKRWISGSKDIDLKFLIHTVMMYSRRAVYTLSWLVVCRTGYLTSSSTTLGITSLFSSLFICIPDVKFILSDSFQHAPIGSSHFWVLMFTMRHLITQVWSPSHGAEMDCHLPLCEHKASNSAVPDDSCFTGSWRVLSVPSVLCPHALQINLVFPVLYLHNRFF